MAFGLLFQIQLVETMAQIRAGETGQPIDGEALKQAYRDVFDTYVNVGIKRDLAKAAVKEWDKPQR